MGNRQRMRPTPCSTSMPWMKSALAPPIVDVEIEDKSVPMELDTGSAYSLLSEKSFRELWPEGELSPSNVRLKSYTGESITVLGCKEVQVKYKDQVARLPLMVEKGAGSSLFGRNWL